MTFAFLIIVLILLKSNYRYSKGTFNPFIILVIPYFFIVLVNNLIIHNYGFYLISDSVLLMLIIGFICFNIGSSLIHTQIPRFTEKDILDKLSYIDICKIQKCLYIIAFLGLINAFFVFRSGGFTDNIDENEGTMGSGPIGHLLLLSHSLFPYVFLKWTFTPKNIRLLLPVILIFFVTFLSLIKYNIIGIFVELFLLVAIYRRPLLKKGIVILLILVFGIFTSNYAFQFFVSGENMESEFILNHFWTYCSGSLIVDNYIFSSNRIPNVELSYKLLTFIFALPNMFLNKLFDITYFPYIMIQDLPVGTGFQSSNVVDAIGYLYPSNGSSFEIVMWGCVIMVIGLINSLIVKLSRKSTLQISPFIPVYFTYFVFLSFYGTFYILSAPWELVIYTLIIPKLFRK